MPLKGLCTHVDHRVYKYTFGREQDASSPIEFSSLFEHLSAATSSQHCDLCVAPGGDLWHIPYFLQSLGRGSITVINLGMS